MHSMHQDNVGAAYLEGIGVIQDYAKAVEWNQKAAEQGNSGAQYLLGGCYEEGKGVVKDYAKAVEWYQKAAAQGDAEAQRRIKELRKRQKESAERENNKSSKGSGCLGIIFFWIIIAFIITKIFGQYRRFCE